jgi:hypothetical protein
MKMKLEMKKIKNPKSRGSGPLTKLTVKIASILQFPKFWHLSASHHKNN